MAVGVRTFVWVALLSIGCAGRPAPSPSSTSTSPETASGPGPAPDIRRVSALPKTLELATGGSTEISFELRSSAPATVEIFSEDGAKVRTLSVPPATNGRRSIVWDGKGEDGVAVSTGVYLYRISATDAQGRTATFGTRSPGPLDEVLAQKFTYDEKSRKVSFILPEPASVRLRMGIRDLPVMRTYYEWVPLEAGRHEIEWDGWDSSRAFELALHPDVRMGLYAKALPPQSILVRSEPPDTSNPCAEICFQVELPDRLGTSEDGLAIVGDEVTVRVSLDPRERARLVNTRFEVMFFLDTIYLYEDEDAAPVFNYQLDTSALPPGKHLLTINVLSYDDRLGARSLEFVKGGDTGSGRK